jgi:broad specificity phosphatase PhoE
MRKSAILWSISLLLLAARWPVAAQKAVIVVRHADNEGDRLTEAGRNRAERLEKALSSADVTAVFSTDSKRTLGTVAPLAEARKLTVGLYDTANGAGGFDARPFVAHLKKDHPDAVVLVVGHVTTIPDLLEALGCPGLSVAPLDFDDLFVVVPAGTGAATVVRLKY